MTQTKKLYNYKFEKTKNKNLFRVVDETGSWKNYFWKPTKQYLRAVSNILDEGYATGNGLKQFFLNHTKQEADEILKNAGDRGDKCHKMISYLLNNKGVANRGTEVWNEESQSTEMLTNDEWRVVLTWVEWWKAHSPVMVAEEFPVYALNLGYAGTTDFIGILTTECGKKTCPCHDLKGKVGIFDWKTSSGIRDSYGAQIASYANAENIKKFDYTAIVRIGTKHTCGYEFEVYDKIGTLNHFNEFLAAQTISMASHTPFDPTKEIYEIPLTINITIKQNENAKLKKVSQRKSTISTSKQQK
jgi:hypothetical protein